MRWLTALLPLLAAAAWMAGLLLAGPNQIQLRPVNGAFVCARGGSVTLSAVLKNLSSNRIVVYGPHRGCVCWFLTEFPVAIDPGEECEIRLVAAVPEDYSENVMPFPLELEVAPLPDPLRSTLIIRVVEAAGGESAFMDGLAPVPEPTESTD
ncbi:MAG: hypothetical protein KDA91_03205 [Planctomycetaceae bacterium]|nr:hypothetical protein [Planctomycetaceae bacterium]